MLARLYRSATFKLAFIVLLVVFVVLVSNGNATGVRAVLEPIFIVAGVVMLLSAAADRHLRSTRQD
jgi:lipopolysaccharide export LptBFGC system permease protein LptF